MAIASSRAQFCESQVNFHGADLASGEVSFHGSSFSGAVVAFHDLTFSGGTLDLAEVGSWARPPVGLRYPAPPGLRLPKAFD
jgi:hypothetical protein